MSIRHAVSRSLSGIDDAVFVEYGPSAVGIAQGFLFDNIDFPAEEGFAFQHRLPHVPQADARIFLETHEHVLSGPKSSRSTEPKSESSRTFHFSQKSAIRSSGISMCAVLILGLRQVSASRLVAKVEIPVEIASLRCAPAQLRSQ